MYIGQERFSDANLCHRRIHVQSEEENLDMLERIIYALHDLQVFNEKNKPGLEAAIDGQLSNWMWRETKGGHRLVYIDTSTPLFKRAGKETLNPDLLLKSAPGPLRAIIKLFFLDDVMNRYYRHRDVYIDLVANLYKEQRPDLIPVFLKKRSHYPQSHTPVLPGRQIHLAIFSRREANRPLGEAKTTGPALRFHFTWTHKTVGMCDTFVALPPNTQNGAIVFGKNSDREPNEMQALEYHPRRQYEPGGVLQCTYLAIPQVKETHAMWLGRPFWMWGAEFGVNEHGLAIGNEAVWTRMPIRKKGGLTGMDLLRLALERATTARQGLEVITGLLADHGQGGICGLYDRSMAYHNSYILADTQEAWVLETADHLWVAKQVKSSYAISNGLTIGAEYDLIHPDAVAHARREGLLKKGKDFDFAACYADWLYTTFPPSNNAVYSPIAFCGIIQL
ncbi:MAG: C69 family dipeptidase [Saprospiraceae bacterium]|nr:C69 family dipeptidase [Saprospiraceae bacterium]